MKVAELIRMAVDIDVYDDVCEELGIAFCGPIELTDAGKEEFADVMGYEVEINPHSYGGYPAAIVKVDGPDGNAWRTRLRKAKAFFDSAAGYCPADDFDKWFVLPD